MQLSGARQCYDIVALLKPAWRMYFCSDLNMLINSYDAGDGILGLGANTMPANALTPKVARASAAMALAV